MPSQRYSAPYGFQWTAVYLSVASANAARWNVETANKTTARITLGSTITAVNTSDSDSVGVDHIAMLGHGMEIPKNPRQPKLTARFIPAVATHSLGIVDEFGFSAVAYRLHIRIKCYISVPGIGWLPDQRVTLINDTNSTTHSSANPLLIRGGMRAAIWNLPRQRYPNGLLAWVGFQVYNGAGVDDVSLTASATVNCTLKDIILSYRN